MGTNTQRPAAAFSSGYTCQLIDEAHRKVDLFLQAGLLHLAGGQVRRMTKAAGYLRANFSETALSKGPVIR